jgi:anti-anti-sigma regulatory factor
MTGWDDTDDAAAGPAHHDTAALEPAPGPAPATAIDLGTRPDAAALVEALIGWPSDVAPLVDASRVERLSGAAMQVLLAGSAEAARQGRRLRVLNPSFAFTLVFEAFGLGGDNEPFVVEFS